MKRIPKIMELVNPETGEIVRVVGIIPEERDNGYVKVFKLFTQKVINDLKAGIDGAINTLMWFINQIQDLPPDSDPIVIAEPEKIAQELGVTERTVRRHLKLLKDHGYLEQVRDRHHVYRVNPRMIFKGVLTRYFRKGRMHHAQGDDTTPRSISSSGNEEDRDLRSR